MKFRPHHIAWLSNHPHRTSEWLRRMTKEGFDVHHLDGDHSNNNPLNLVLVDHLDHMRLHKAGKTFNRMLFEKKEKKNKRDFVMGRRAYLLRNNGFSWEQARDIIKERYGVDKNIYSRAKKYSKMHNWPWPAYCPVAQKASSWVERQQWKESYKGWESLRPNAPT